MVTHVPVTEKGFNPSRSRKTFTILITTTINIIIPIIISATITLNL